MSTKQQAKQAADQEQERGQQQLEAAIGKHLLHALGEPADLQRLQVQRLWDNHYRANVIVGESLVSARVAHSFFLVVDGAGAIMTATPPISRVC